MVVMMAWMGSGMWFGGDECWSMVCDPGTKTQYGRGCVPMCPAVIVVLRCRCVGVDSRIGSWGGEFIDVCVWYTQRVQQY